MGFENDLALVAQPRDTTGVGDGIRAGFGMYTFCGFQPSLREEFGFRDLCRITFGVPSHELYLALLKPH